MLRSEYEAKLRLLIEQVWHGEILWADIEAWVSNFDGQVCDEGDEQLYGLYALSRFMYFGRQLVREMLKSLYRDHFESPMLQRIRRNYHGTSDSKLIRKIYAQELSGTRFVGVGNPAESGAHLLYYFRQVNHLAKDLFVDLTGAFTPILESRVIQYLPRDSSVSRYVFFDDLVGSGTQAKFYLENHLREIRAANKGLELRFMSLFATTKGLEQINKKELFDGHAMCLFELDDTYKAFSANARYFSNPPSWFARKTLFDIVKGYGEKLWPAHPLGYQDGQLLLGFAHNTPDNAPPIFWDEGNKLPWSPIFIRYDKIYGGAP
jgi:hypothetical protein